MVATVPVTLPRPAITSFLLLVNMFPVDLWSLTAVTALIIGLLYLIFNRMTNFQNVSIKQMFKENNLFNIDLNINFCHSNYWRLWFIIIYEYLQLFPAFVTLIATRNGESKFRV
jgi:hypothetical protein